MSNRITKKDVERIRELDALSYFKNYVPDELVRNGRNNSYYLRSHDSLKLSNGMWYQWSTRIGGKSALDYLIKIEGWQFKDVCHYLLDLINEHPPVLEVAKPRTKVPLRLPEENISNNDVIDYLVNKRKLDLELINSLIEGGLIYQERHSNNVVFIGFDLMCEPRFACKRATDSSFKQDCLGSDKRFSFNITSDSNEELHVFESAIDLLSYITLLKMKNVDYRQYNYLSLSGVGDNESYLPISLESYLSRYHKIKKIILHLDNDLAGKSSTENITRCCKGLYETEDCHPINHKDINEELISKVKTHKEA